MPLTKKFIKLLRSPTEEIISKINKEFLQANHAKEILRFVGNPYKSFTKLDPECKSSFEEFSDGNAETFKEMHKKASDVFKHVFAFLDLNKKREVISGNEYDLFRTAAIAGSFPQVKFLIEEAKKLGQEIFQPMISARNYQGFHDAIQNTHTSEYEEEEKKIYQLILDSVSKENLILMITSFYDKETTLLKAVRNNRVDLVKDILNNVFDDNDQLHQLHQLRLRELISSTIADNDFPLCESKPGFGMVLEKASDLDIDLQQFLLQHKDLLLDNTTRPGFAEAFKKHASEETLKATVSSFLASPESKNNFFTQAIIRNKELESVVNSLILSPQIEQNLNDLSRTVGSVKIDYGKDKQLAKSSRYLLAVLHLKNDGPQINPVSTTFNSNLGSSMRIKDLYKSDPTPLLGNDLNQTTIDRLQELRNELIENFDKNFSQKYSNLGSQSDLTAEEKAKLAKEKAKEKANLTIKGLLENDGLKKFNNLANQVFALLSDKFTVGVFKKFSAYASEITLKGLDGSEREVALEGIAEFFEKRSRDVILKKREINQNNSSNNSNEDSVVEDAEPETESVASKEANVTSEVPANEESNKNSNEDSNEDSVVEAAELETESVASKEANVTSEVPANEESNEDSNENSGVRAAEPKIKTESVASESKEVNFTSKVSANEESKPNPNPQIENHEISNLKRRQQSLYNSSENPNESSDKNQRT